MMPVLGHVNVERRFLDALRAGRLHHAWLLHGVRGIGKRMLADRLAALAFCRKRTACGSCHACRMLAAGAHPDLFHAQLPDGKRDISIDQIREVLAFLALSGAEGERRIVILDDAERMNRQAANALLKGLEEPSPGSLLLMVCADIDRLPATVRSRCLLQPCAPLSDADVGRALAGMDIEPAAMDLAIELADGAPGRVLCLQDAKLAAALESWRQLTADMARADIGELESWIRQYVGSVPHTLIVQLLARPVYDELCRADTGFTGRETLHRAWQTCLRWPGDVIRHSLRPAPSLLAVCLGLRTALRDLPGKA